MRRKARPHPAEKSKIAGGKGGLTPMIQRGSAGPVLIALACSAVAFTISVAAAQEAFPAKPIKLIVPLAAGGGIDFTARATAQKLSDVLGSRWWSKTRAEAAERSA